MRKSGSLPLLIVAVIAIGVFVATLALGNKPGLGLDLQGGISVVLQPVVNGQPQKKVPAEALDQTKQIIENRVNAIGVGEPDITVQGKDILVELPGIKDQKRALSLVGQTAQLRFRPVLSILGSTPGKSVTDRITKLRKKLKVPKGVTGLDVLNDERSARGQSVIADPNAPTTTTVPGATPTTVPGATTTTGAAATTTVPATSTTTPGTGTGGSSSAKVARLRADSSTTTVAPTTTEKSKATTTTVPATTSTTTTTINPAPVNKYKIKVYKDKHGTLNSDLNTLITLEQEVEQATTNPITPEAQDKPGATVTLPGQDTGSGVTNYKLGPQALSGSAIEGATAGLGTDGKWTVVTGVTYRHPGLLAKTISTLDVLSGGRARLGIGAAWNEQEHQGLGVPFPSTSERFERLGEALEICEQMWGSDEGPYAGRHFQLAETVNSPTNVSTPAPEIMIGGMGPNKTLRLAARHAGSVNWFPVGESDFVAAKDHLARHCAAINRDPDTIRVTLTGFLMGRDGAEGFLAQMEQYASWGVDEVFVAPVANDPRTDVEWWVEDLIPRLATI